MRLKSFQAATMAEAMRQVRAVLGDDAIIVATRADGSGGVRVTAAIEDETGPAASAAGRMPPGPRFGRAEPARTPEIDTADAVADALCRHGTPAPIVDRLVSAVAALDIADPRRALGAALDALFDFEPLPEGPAPKPIMLVGPPGAGKTLTAAKLAARAILRGRSVGVLTTDTVRAGGIDQLQAFTRLLKLKLIAVEDAGALADALTVQRGVEQVIIDSAGRNPFDPDDMRDLGELLDGIDIEPVLVLPAGGDAYEAADIATAFRILGARRVLVTRLDMTRRLGSVLACAYESRLSFSDASLTPKVAEGLTPLTPAALARLIMPAADSDVRSAKQTGTFS